MEDAEVESLRRRLLAESFPRLQMVLLLALAGLGAFFCSTALLYAGVSSMPLRYALAAVVGYLLFLALGRVWLSWQWRRWLDLELPALGSGGGSGGGSELPSFSGEGGSFAGGGASGSFGSPAPAASSSSFGDLVPDGLDAPDEALPIALVVLAALALVFGLLALGLVVYASPVLFAEALLDAAVVGALYRSARRRSRGHWLEGVLRRTWAPAAALCVFVALAGLALQIAAPGAHSLGAVVDAREWR